MSAAAAPGARRNLSPGLVSLIRSLLINVLGAYLVYRIAETRFPATSVMPLLLSALVPAAELAATFVRKRTVEVVAVIALVELLASVGASLAVQSVSGGMAIYALQPVALALVFGVSLVMGRPLMQFLARTTVAGDDVEHQARFDAMAATEGARRVFRRITMAWVVVLCVETAVRLAASRILPASTYFLVSNILGYSVIALLIWGSIRFGRYAASRAQTVKPG